MADNTTLNAGSGGDVIATDDISGVKYQRVKLTLGADGVNGGDVSSTNALPISDNGSSLTVDNGGTFAVQAAQSGTWTLGSNSGVDIGDVTINNGSGAGAVYIQDGGNSITIDGSVTANQPAATAYKMIYSDGTNDVPIDAAHADGETNTENHIDIGAKGLYFNGTTWDRMRGTVADGMLVNLGTNNDVTITGSVAVTDNAGSLTVDGTVAATQSGTWILGANSGVDIGDVTINNAGGASAVNIQDGGNTISIDDAGSSITVDGTVTVTDGLNIEGDVAHDSIDSGNPVKLGAKAIAHGTNPTAVAAADRTDLYANRAGILWTIGGHPNIITRTVYISDATGAQTDASMVGTIAAGTKVAVTQIAVTVDSAVTATGGVSVKVGFGATSIPADSSTGANGILLDHKGIAAGSGVVLGNGSGLIGIGADGEELRLTCEDPVGGGLSVMFSYYTIES